MNELYRIKKSQMEEDEYQLNAFRSRGNTVVFAGPGSGKTTVLLLKLVDILKTQVVPPRGVACFTYSREIARELSDKLNDYGVEKQKNIFVGTIHSFCLNAIIRPYIHLFPNYLEKYNIRIIPKNIQTKIWKDTISLFEDKMNGNIKKYSYGNVVNYKKNSYVGLSKIIIGKEPLNDLIYKEYIKRLVTEKYVDYDLITFLALDMLVKNEFIKKAIEARFQWIFIDEYQDLGKILHEMILYLKSNTKIKIFAVGDINQSIYSFQGASPKYLNELKEIGDMEVIELKNNYRSQQIIIDGFENLLEKKHGYISKIEKKESKFFCRKLKNELIEQFKFISEKIIPYFVSNSIPYDEIAILVKDNKEAESLKNVLEENNFPVYISKYAFDKTEIICWIQNIAKWCNNETTVTFNELFSIMQSIKSVSNYLYDLDRYITDKKDFFMIISSLKKSTLGLYKWIEELINELDLFKLMANNEIYQDELENLKIFLETFNTKELKDKPITYIANILEPRDQIVISTRHSSKGQEFDVVIMTGMEENHFPSKYTLYKPEARAEEKRLCFVSVSRAKRFCIFLWSEIYLEEEHGEFVEKKFDRSSFINEVAKANKTN